MLQRLTSLTLPLAKSLTVFTTPSGASMIAGLLLLVGLAASRGTKGYVNDYDRRVKTL